MRQDFFALRPSLRHLGRDATITAITRKGWSMKQPRFLPMSAKEMKSLGWDALDVLLITGDAYVDHPSFGAAMIGRALVSQGFRTGIIAQPDWKNPASVAAMGRPRLYAGITAGAMDSMVSNYTANKKLRRDDAYAPGDQYGLRPNRATIVYTNLVKQAFAGITVVLGGLEASQRRLVHYDYWDDRLRRSLLLDAKADILVYGMGEKAAITVAQRLTANTGLDDIPGTAVIRPAAPQDQSLRVLPGYEEILADKNLLAKAALLAEQEELPSGRMLAQVQQGRTVLVNPPAAPLSTRELDALYALPFARAAHPSYTEPVPALVPVRFSIVTHRGCFGGCTFCALGSHQGKLIQSRSQQSILSEIRGLTRHPDFRGTISDVGGPSANMYQITCQRPQGPCTRASCLFPERCSYLSTDHAPQLALLKAASRIPGVKHVFVASGLRYDLALADPDYLPGLVAGRHVSGALKIAPEHTDPQVLRLMRKPPFAFAQKFLNLFRKLADRQKQSAQATAYFIASFPGSTPEAMRTLSNQARQENLRVEQMQDFIPLPMTLAGIMYFTGQDPWTQKPLPVAKRAGERGQQRRILLGREAPSRTRPRKSTR